MEEEYLELTNELRNSVEIGESSKGELYLKSLKLYWGYGTVEGEVTIDRLFVLYDKVEAQINARKG